MNSRSFVAHASREGDKNGHTVSLISRAGHMVALSSTRLDNGHDGTCGAVQAGPGDEARAGQRRQQAYPLDQGRYPQIAYFHESAGKRRKSVVTPAETFQIMQQNFNPNAARGLNVTYQFELSGENGGTYALKIADGQCEYIPGGVENPSITLKLSAKDWLQIVEGTLNPQMAFLTQRIKLDGDLSLAMRLNSIFPRK
jgi:putative sterol carrier protein